MFDNYFLGILYGDGYFQKRYNKEYYIFSTTHKEIANKVRGTLEQNKSHYKHYNGEFEEGHTKENYGILEIFEIHDENICKYLNKCGFQSPNASERIQIGKDFIRGYLETKGSIIKYHTRKSEAWRISLSGNREDLEYIKNSLEEKLNINFSKILQRKERIDEGIISTSYRLNLQNRPGVAKLLSYIEDKETTEYIKEKIKTFKQYHTSTPHNMKRKIFKHYKFAVGFMAKELGLTIKGVRGGIQVNGERPIYLWKDNEVEFTFNGWNGAYEWIQKEYEEKTGYNSPKVE